MLFDVAPLLTLLTLLTDAGEVLFYMNIKNKCMEIWMSRKCMFHGNADYGARERGLETSSEHMVGAVGVQYPRMV